MARTGRFGRLPRTAPDLSSAIASLLREMQSQEDANFIDAWQNGGEVNGKPVTDGRLLQHFRQRRNSLDRDDPLWDEWDNRLKQYGFAIEEQKMEVLWDQGKVSEREMSSFYQRWANKAPHNSAFGREMQSAAAKWLASAKKKRSGASAASKQAAHEREVARYYDRKVRAGDTAAGLLIAIAKTYGAMPMSGSSLDDLNPDSVGYGRFMDVYVDGRTNDPFVQDMIDDAERELRRIDPGFRFDKAHIDEAMERADEGMGHLVRISVYKTERDDWQERRGQMRMARNDLRQAPIIQRVFDAQDQYVEASMNCNGDPYCHRRALTQFRDTLAKQGRKLMRGGVDDVNIEIVGALAATQRVLDAAIAGKPLKLTDAQRREVTLFDLNGDDQAAFESDIVLMNENIRLMDEGGWLESRMLEDQGRPVLDEFGDPVFLKVVHAADEPTPVDFVPVTAEGVLEGGPPGQRMYVEPVPVRVQPVLPNGTLVPVGDVTGQVLDPVTGQLTEVGEGYPDTLYHELRGVIGPDGKTRTLYRTGDGTAESPFLFHTVSPTINDPETGLPMETRTTPEGEAVFPVRVSAGAPTPEGKPTFVADLTPYQNTAQALRTRPPGGNYPSVTYQTSSGATAAQVVDGYFDTGRIGGAFQAQAYALGLTAMAAMMRDTNPLESEKMMQDAAQVTRVSAARGRNLTPSQTEYFVSMSEDERSNVEALEGMGVTVERYGVQEVRRRAAAIEKYNQPPAPEEDRSLLARPGIYGSSSGNPFEPVTRGNVLRPGENPYLREGIPQLRLPVVAGPNRKRITGYQVPVEEAFSIRPGPSAQREAGDSYASFEGLPSPKPAPSRVPPPQMVGPRGAGPTRTTGLTPPKPTPKPPPQPNRSRTERPRASNPQPRLTNPQVRLPSVTLSPEQGKLMQEAYRQRYAEMQRSRQQSGPIGL